MVVEGQRRKRGTMGARAGGRRTTKRWRWESEAEMHGATRKGRRLRSTGETNPARARESCTCAPYNVQSSRARDALRHGAFLSTYKPRCAASSKVPIRIVFAKRS